MKHNDEGFTLVELLIVIVILGILATVVVFAVGNITDNADETACVTEKRTVETAVEAYRAQNGDWPDSVDDLVPDILRSPPTYFTVGEGDGTVTPTEDAPCS